MRDPSMEHAASGLTNTKGLDKNLNFSEKEIQILRELTNKVAEISIRQIEEEKKKRWTSNCGSFYFW